MEYEIQAVKVKYSILEVNRYCGYAYCYVSQHIQPIQLETYRDPYDPEWEKMWETNMNITIEELDRMFPMKLDNGLYKNTSYTVITLRKQDV